MPRPKKDPDIRRHEFIKAAGTLFFTKGYKSVSIQDVLDFVGERSVSPSVFYYYFDSKEDLYQAVMENYCDEYTMLINSSLSDETIAVEERFINAMQIMTKTLGESLGRVDDSETIGNRLFALDLRDRTTRRISGILAETLQKYPLPGKSSELKKNMSMYITGGISEIINHIMFNPGTTEKEMKRAMRDIMRFTADVIGVPRIVLKRITERQQNEK